MSDRNYLKDMNEVYQYIIIDNENDIEFDASNLYRNEENCERDALMQVHELNIQSDSDDRFGYRIIASRFVD